jgi:hypothetical protein
VESSLEKRRAAEKAELLLMAQSESSFVLPHGLSGTVGIIFCTAAWAFLISVSVSAMSGVWNSSSAVAANSNLVTKFMEKQNLNDSSGI